LNNGSSSTPTQRLQKTVSKIAALQGVLKKIKHAWGKIEIKIIFWKILWRVKKLEINWLLAVVVVDAIEFCWKNQGEI